MPQLKNWPTEFCLHLEWIKHDGGLDTVKNFVSGQLFYCLEDEGSSSISEEQVVE